VDRRAQQVLPPDVAIPMALYPPDAAIPMSPFRWRFYPLVLVVLLCGWSALLFVRYTQTVAPGWDSLAYKVAGERLAAGQDFSYCHPYNAQIGPYFTLSGFNVQAGDDACLYLNYPIGFPLLLAAAQRLFGSLGLEQSASVAWYVPALSATVELVAVFGIGSVLFGRWAGLWSAVVLAFAPTRLVFGTSLWSDLPGVAALTCGLALYLWAERTTRARLRWAGAGVAGIMVVLGLFTRYANGVMLLPWVAYVLLSQKRAAARDAVNWIFGAVVLAGVVGILLFNRSYYGGYLSTPYGPEHGWYAWPAFSLRYAFGESPVGGQSMPATARTIWSNFAWLLLPAAWGVVRMRAPQRALLLGSVLVAGGLYSCYAFPPQGVNARFLLPAFPFIGLSAGYGLWCVPGVLQPHRRETGGAGLWRVLGVVVIGLVMLVPLPGHLRDIAARNAGDAAYVGDVKQLVADTDSDAVFLAYGTNDAIAYYGQRMTLFYRRIPPFDPATDTYRWDELEPRLVEAVERLLEQGEPVYYVQDSDPPFADSLNVLNRHFDLSLQEGKSLPVYRVRARVVE